MLKITKNISEANLITHSSEFHADDVFATAFLCKIIKNPVLCRTSQVPENISNEVIVYDIGGDKFDHHQKDFNKRHDDGVKYASFGLLFKEFGLSYLKNINKKYAKDVYLIVEHDLIESIDAIDNGEFPKIDTPYKYKDLDSIIGDFNAPWDDETDNDFNFLDAVNVAEKIFDAVINRSFALARAKEIVEHAIDKSNNHIMFLEKYVPFKNYIILSKSEKAKDILFVITPSKRGGYSIHTIPKNKNTHETRCDFPPSWGGLMDNELQKVSGVKSATFCHSTLFLASCKTLDDAYLLAKKAIDYAKKNTL